MAEFKVIGGPRDGTTYLMNVEQFRFCNWMLLAPPMIMSGSKSVFRMMKLDRYAIDWKEKVLKFDPERK